MGSLLKAIVETEQRVGTVDEQGHDQAAGDGRPLWAPWRIEYILAPKDGDCFLCAKAASRDQGDHVIARGTAAFVLLNVFPYNAGHVLIAPYRHVADLTDMDTAELTEMMTLTVKAEKVMRRTMNPQGFNLGFNLGEAAGAGVRDHVHAHLIPRWVGDTNFMSAIGATRVVPQALADTAALLREAWAEEEDATSA